MIVFDLKCRKDHVFEAWFRDSATFEAQVAAKEVPCPVCGDTKIVKAPMAPAVAASGDKSDPAPREADADATGDGTPAEAAPSADTPSLAEVHGAMRKLRTFIEKNSDNVGDKFASEARKIHKGEAKARNIHGEATPSEAKSLKDDGVPFAAIPWPSRTDS